MDDWTEDLVVDSLDSETNDNQITRWTTGPRIWLSTVSISGSPHVSVGPVVVPPGALALEAGVDRHLRSAIWVFSLPDSGNVDAQTHEVLDHAPQPAPATRFQSMQPWRSARPDPRKGHKSPISRPSAPRCVNETVRTQIARGAGRARRHVIQKLTW